MKIAFIGIRGIPVVYSGYETFSEIMASELVKKGHSVTVYCRSAYVNPKIKSHKGVNLIVLPTIRSKNLDTIIHSFLSTVHACFFDYDTVLYLSVGNSIFSILPRLCGKRTIVNVDGMDWKRKKWEWFAKWFLNTSEFLSTFLPNEIVTDSYFIRDYYLNKYNKKSTYIPYGGFIGNNKNDGLFLKKYNLKKNSYLIWNGRLVPDNHIEDLVLALRSVKNDIKCIILGGDLYKDTYVQSLKKLASSDKRIIFPGFILHDHAEALVRNSFAYIETKRSGGTHPSLVEAMSVGALIISDNCEANMDVLGKTAYFYDLKLGANDLSDKISHIFMKRFSSTNNRLKQNVQERYKKTYGWNAIIGEYERILCQRSKSTYR